MSVRAKASNLGQNNESSAVTRHGKGWNLRLACLTLAKSPAKRKDTDDNCRRLYVGCMPEHGTERGHLVK